MADIIMPHGGRLVHEEPVQSGWVDYNGHMNVAYYVLVFDHGTDAMLSLLNMGPHYRAETDSSDFVVESHITYMSEVLDGDPLQVATAMLAHDDKRLHLFHHMYHRDRGDLCATNEVMLVHVDMKSRRSAHFPPQILENLRSFAASQQSFERASQVGSVMGIKNG
jgi:acyl-CoA thioester hydrolase